VDEWPYRVWRNRPKLAATIELEALMGWKPGSRMVALYTRSRNDALLAERIGDKMLADERTKGADSNPAPPNKVRVL
jgi:hypothetical protein